jgi:hypothetical protein
VVRDVQAKHLAFALEQEGIKVDIRPPQGIPDNLSDLQNYETIILSNVPATAMPKQAQPNPAIQLATIGAAGEFIVARSEKGEMVIEQPLQVSAGARY